MVTRKNMVGELLMSDDDKEELLPQIPLEADDLSDDEFVLSVLNQIGEDDDKAKVIAYRVVEGKPDTVLRRYTPAEFASTGFEDLLNSFGGGTYRIRVYGQNSRVMGNRKISIEEPRNFKPKVEEKPADTQILQVMQQGFERMGNMFAQTLQAMQKPTESRMDFLRELALMKEMFAPAQNQQRQSSSPEATIDLFMKGLAMGKEINSPEPSENGVLLGMVDKLAPVLLGSMLNQNGASNAPTQSPEQIQTNGEVTDVNFMVKQALNFMVSQAEKGSDPVTYAYMVLDNVPEAEVQQLLNTPDWMQRLEALRPGIMQHAHWFNELRAAVLELLTQEPENGINNSHANGKSDSDSPANAHDDSIRGTGDI